MKRPPIVILAGGKGTRLRSITGRNTPKPMVDVFGKPFLYWLIKHYTNQGFTDIHISTGYKAEVIEKYPWQVPVTFHRDPWPWGPSQAALTILADKQRWVVNADTFLVASLPSVYPGRSCVVSYGGEDAGAQCLSNVLSFPTQTFESRFYDIGEPASLGWFREFFEKHYLYLSERQD